MRFELDHIMPKSRGGTDKVSNLVYSCRKCNMAKGAKTATEFGHPEVSKKAEHSLKDAAAVNTIRWKLLDGLKAMGLEVELGTGGHTKFNRARLGLIKDHCIDAVCVGASTPDKIEGHIPEYVNIWKLMGRGKHQIVILDKYGFPRLTRNRAKRIQGFATGDIVKSLVGKYAGNVGRLVARTRGPYMTALCETKPMSCRYNGLQLIQRSDGWDYGKRKISQGSET